MPVPKPPTPFPVCSIVSFPAGTDLYRTHKTVYAGNGFHSSPPQQRFSPIIGSSGKIIASLYAATTPKSAVFESIYHDVNPRALFKTVRSQDVFERSITHTQPVRDLKLVSLFATDLMAWGLMRTDLIETPKSEYLGTAQWAEAVHRANPDVDGLLWTSVRCDPERCLVLFGDRVASGDLKIMSSQRLTLDSRAFADVRQWGRAADITIITQALPKIQ